MIWPGQRIIKTFVAVFLCLLVAHLFNYENPYYALISVTIVMKQSSTHSFKHGLNRMIGSIFGGLFGFIFIFARQFIGSNISLLGILLISTLVLLDLWIAKLLHFEEYASTVSTILLLSVLMNYSETSSVAAHYLTVRIIETFVGISISVLVNHYLGSVLDLFKTKNEINSEA